MYFNSGTKSKNISNPFNFLFIFSISDKYRENKFVASPLHCVYYINSITDKTFLNKMYRHVCKHSYATNRIQHIDHMFAETHFAFLIKSSQMRRAHTIYIEYYMAKVLYFLMRSADGIHNTQIHLRWCFYLPSTHCAYVTVCVCVFYSTQKPYALNLQYNKVKTIFRVVDARRRCDATCQT